MIKYWRFFLLVIVLVIFAFIFDYLANDDGLYQLFGIYWLDNVAWVVPFSIGVVLFVSVHILYWNSMVRIWKRLF